MNDALGAAAGYARRGTPERESEVVLSLVASGLVRMRTWAGVRKRQRPYDDSLQLGLDRLAVVCARAGVRPPVGAGDLVWDWCAGRPLNDWPLTFHADAEVGGELLLIDTEPSDFCQEWSVAGSDVVAEVHESALVAHVKEVADALGRPELYAEWRKLVTENSVLTAAELLSLKGRFLAVSQWATWLDESYEEVPAEATLQGSVAVCPACQQWIAPTTAGIWRCSTLRCTVARSVPDPELRPAQGTFRLRAELVRFVALPGRPELALATALAARGARVVLYPGLDALDLVARWPSGYSVGVDVKDWRKPYLLARNIKQFPSWRDGHPYSYRRACLVVPDDRVEANQRYCEIVRKHSQALREQPHIEVLTVQELVGSCPDIGSPGEVVCGP